MIATRRTRLIACIVLTVTLLSACASTSSPAGSGKLDSHRVTVGERERTYLLYTPAGTLDLAGGRPLIIVFHGGGGTARGISREVGRSLHDIADRQGIFVVYPNAVGKMWDFGAGKTSESLEVRIDDRSFFAALIDDVAGTFPVDADRVFATGISRGGQASYFMACQFPDRIRAIAPVAMPMPVYMTDLCDVDGRMGVAVFNGTADPLVPYDGGAITVRRRERDQVMSTDETIAFWRSRNRCAADAPDSRLIDATDDRMRVLKTSWTRCDLDPVILYRIEGGGHTWPSGRQYLPKAVVGPVNRDIDAAEEIWAFFSQFR